MDLTCPKCRGVMRSYERNGVTIDQCTECRGIFLDRGELERLIDAEAAFNAAAAAAAVVPPPSPRSSTPAYGSPNYGSPNAIGREPGPGYRQERYDSDRGYRQPRYDSDRNTSGSDGYYRKKRKRSFLEDLFD